MSWIFCQEFLAPALVPRNRAVQPVVDEIYVQHAAEKYQNGWRPRLGPIDAGSMAAPLHRRLFRSARIILAHRH